MSQRTLRTGLAALVLFVLAAPVMALTVFPLPTAYWSFDLCDSGKAMDDTATWSDSGAHHVTMKNGATCGTGRYGTGGNFDGTNDVAETSTDLDFTNAMTVSAWVYPKDVGRWQTIANKWYWPDSWGLFIEPGMFNFTVSLPSGNVSVRYPASTWTWTHVTAVYTGSQVRLYTNGVLRATASASGTINNSSRPIAIGGHPSWNAFNGYIDEVKVWGQALTGTQVSQLATTPSGVGVRGVHLYGSQWAADPSDSNHGQHVRDLSLLQTVANLNSVKSTIFTYVDQSTYYGYWHGHQRDKLRDLKAAAGNHVTWVFRAWPTPADFAQASSWFDKGYVFAQNLASVFYHLRYELKLQNVVIEVANEPNINLEGFTDSSGWPNLSYYNDFFRGFYWGERSVGYDLPLAYAGLSPGDYLDSGGVKRYNSTVWYQNASVQSHIRDYAAKVGVHIYWQNGARNASNEGKYYREIKNILAAGGVSPRGLVFTEFNAVRSTFSGNHKSQIDDVCLWWKEEAADAAAGYWVEQAMVYVSYADDASDQTNYTLADSQLDEIRDCR